MNDRKRVFAFIDSQNLNLGTQKMGWKMDWRKFREFLQIKYNVSHAYMFIGHVPEFEDLYMQMHDLGYLVVLKPTLETGKKPQEKPKPGEKPEPPKAAVKGNVDAELVLYAMKEMSNYDQCIIVSGDGDFFSLVEYMEKKGRLAHILAPNWQYSSLLKPYEKYIVRLDQLRNELAYRDRRRNKK